MDGCVMLGCSITMNGDSKKAGAENIRLKIQLDNCSVVNSLTFEFQKGQAFRIQGMSIIAQRASCTEGLSKGRSQESVRADEHCQLSIAALHPHHISVEIRRLRKAKGR
uniref:Uncharacterized protein n=1 Tax=Oryza nivara TaxID=4536 RepID=A0A0E0FGM1_ORYNI